MSEYFNPSHHEEYPDFEACAKLQGSVLGGILGSAVGMFVCILVLLLCWLYQIERFSITLQLFAGLVIGGFYRLFHGRRSKTAAYVTVGICTLLACSLWVVISVLLPAALSETQLTADDWNRRWSMTFKLLLLCDGTGLTGFFFTRRTLLTYADWKRGPWHIAYANAGGASYNLLPEKLPNKNPPVCFVVHSRFAPGTRIIVEGSSLQWKSRFRKDRICSVHDIAGVVLGPSGGCNVIYDKNYQVLAKFAGSMEHADLLLVWLIQRNIPIHKAPVGWRSPDEASPDPESVKVSVPQQQFTLRLKRSTRIGFIGIGWFFLLIGLALFLLIDVRTLTMAEGWAISILELAVMGMGIIYLRIGKVCQVKIDGERIHAVSRFGRAAKFSVKEVFCVSRNMGWIVLYDRDFKTLAKLDSYLENLDRLKEYLEFYGIKM